LQIFVAFLPFFTKKLKSLKILPYEVNPKTLGGHLKKRRLELRLFQKDLRKLFKLEKETYANWEKDKCIPSMRYFPMLINFLGYDPLPEPVTMGEKLLAYRRRNGISRKSLAKEIGVDEGTLQGWEEDRRKPSTEAHVFQIQKLLGTTLA
jgi:DNA-binding XRE family transcriptional regulator